MRKKKMDVTEILQQKKTREILKTDLTKEEIAAASQLLVEHLQSVEILKEEKKAAVSSYNSRLDEYTKEISRLGAMVRDKYEYRHVDCMITFNFPESALKILTRIDDGSIIRTEPMTDQERQEVLFKDNALSLNE